MYLKRLEIQGFKSFAEKISLEFNSGITSIVGPNGSGKSNVSDAVRWVLGEQSIKTLRGSKMEDVIFSGTEHRKPLGFAEVSLTLDNSDSYLPIAFSEVTIARRIFRSGESEYFINKTSCRLKDINELFVDTGVGKEGYSIMGQGRIDEVLSTKSEDRRRIFEEASGIMKYKTRKIEAEKKLELTKQNLIRINDIIIELENQIEPLRIQADVARKYLDLRENLKLLEVNIYLDNITKFKEKVKEFETQFKAIRENIDNENEKLVDITDVNKKKNDLMKFLEEKLNNSRQEYYNFEGNLERCNSEIKINDEKINNLNQNIFRIDSEMAEINQKINVLEKEEGTKQDRIFYLNKKHDEYSGKLEEYEKQMNIVIESLNETERYIEDLKTDVMNKLDLLSDKKAQLNNTRIYVESIKKRQNNIDNEIFQISVEKDKENMTYEDLAENIYKTKEIIKKSKENIEKQKNLCESNNRNLTELNKKQNEIKSELQYKNSRYRMLKDMESNLEGYSKSVREILGNCRRTEEIDNGVHGALAQLISVDKKYETAIEMSLGSILQNIVTTSEHDAKKAIEFLKTNKFGRATFLPISSVKGKYFENTILNEIKKQDGFCGVASDLVCFKEQYKGIILNFLGKVVVVDNLDKGIKIARKFGYEFRIVTLDGDILSTSGSIAGGSTENRGTGILSRTREIAELQNDLEKLKQNEAALDMKINEAIDMIEEVEKNISIEEGILKNNEPIKIRDESHLAQIVENIKKASAKIEMLKQEKAQLIKQESEMKDEYDKYTIELKEIENDITKTKKIIAEHQEKHKEDQSVRDLLHRDITDFKISVNSIIESIESVKEAIGRIAGERDISMKSINKRNNEKNKNTEEIKILQERNAGLVNTIKGFEEEKTGRTLEIDRISEERKVMEEELYDIVNRINETNKNILLLQEDLSRIEIKKSKIEAEMEAIQNRMWDEYELTYYNAFNFRKDIGSTAQAQKKTAEIKNEIRELGPVNVAAIDDYIKTKERYEFMTAQRNDMEQAEGKLQRVIYEMTSIMKQQFIEQFKLINENFNIVFKELFDGGYAKLVIADNENILESGIEIEVQPPGKKLQNMMLLSGGERALTATAILFSLLRLKPTPFCLLDEIEATLDDANITRFAEYIRKFTNQTQFIIITHRKGTMEISDTLYGVTMQEHGISKIVSMKMGEKAS